MSKTIQIVELLGNGAIELPFPEEINSTIRTNWNNKDAPSSQKPHSLTNRELEEITLKNITLDSSATTDKSIEATIEKLRGLMKETTDSDSQQSPLAMLLPDRQFRCVLTGIRINRETRAKQNVCIQAVISLTFQELE